MQAASVRRHPRDASATTVQTASACYQGVETLTVALSPACQVLILHDDDMMPQLRSTVGDSMASNIFKATHQA